MSIQSRVERLESNIGEGCSACNQAALTFTLTGNSQNKSSLPLGTHSSQCGSCGRELETIVFTLAFDRPGEAHDYSESN